MTDSNLLTAAVRWNDQGLVAAVAQDWQTGEVLMLAWMNAEALALTAQEGRAVYWSRSREQLWRKGESSGNLQRVRELRLDCDADAVLLKVEQLGGIACHTGRRSCFYQRWQSDAWVITDTVIKTPEELYGKPE